MYWWKVSALAEDFREGRVGERERFKYYMAFTVLMTIGIVLASYAGQQFTIVNLALDALGAVVTIGGTVLCYRANKRGDNADFIGRMICLTWPIGIKVLVLFVIASIVSSVPVIIILWEIHGDTGSLGWDVFFNVSVLAAGICYYWLTYKYITLVAGGKEELAGQS